MSESFVVHIVFNLSEHGFRFYASLPSVFQPFLRAEQLFSFPLVSPKSVIQFYRPVSFALKQRHLSGQPSHLTALYRAVSLTYPDAVFTCLVPILRIFCPIGQMQKVMFLIVVKVFGLERIRFESRPPLHVEIVVLYIGIHAVF